MVKHGELRHGTFELREDMVYTILAYFYNRNYPEVMEEMRNDDSLTDPPIDQDLFTEDFPAEFNMMAWEAFGDEFMRKIHPKEICDDPEDTLTHEEWLKNHKEEWLETYKVRKD